jgi:hypothetical protein
MYIFFIDCIPDLDAVYAAIHYIQTQYRQLFLVIYLLKQLLIILHKIITLKLQPI